MSDQEQEQEFSFKRLFIPLTTFKAIHFIIIIGLIVFFNSLFNNFLGDDNTQILNNPFVHSITTIPYIFNNYNAQQVNGYYRPVPNVIYAVLYTLFQKNTFFYHFIQLSFHMGNAILIFLIFKKFIKIGIAFFLALLFLIHPINVEAVAYIADLQDVLFVFFGLLSFYFLQLHPEKQKYIIYANIFLLISIFSKETGILFAVINLFYIYLTHKKKLLMNLGYTFGISIIYLILRFASHVPIQKSAQMPIMDLSFPQRMINVPEIIFYYIKTFLFPKDLIAYQSWVIKDIQFTNFILPLFLDLLFIGILLLLFRYLCCKEEGSKLALLFFVWFIIGLIFHLQIIPLDLTVADRWFYFPIIGLLAIIGLFINTLTFNRRGKTALFFLVIILLLTLSVRTMVRNTNWLDESTLIVHDEKIDNKNYFMEVFYSNYLIKNNKYDEALPRLRRAISLYPRGMIPWNSLGVIYLNKGEYPKAKDAYLKSIALGNNIAYENMAWLLISHGNINEARDFIRKSNSKYPDEAKLWYYRILVEYKLNNYDEALNAAKKNYLLTQDQNSYNIYLHLQQKLPINIQ